MKLVKPMALSFTCRPLLLFGRQRLSVTSMVGFSLVEGERRLIPEIELWPAIAKATGALVDEGLPKARGEALVFGSCHTPGARPLAASFVRLQLGTIDKKLSVIGDRYWQESAWKNPTTEPVPFTEMPLTWDRAFGGPDYAKNPLGRGIIEDGGKVPLPNIELGRGLISARSERPEPAGFGSLEVGWTQRIALAGSYDEKWLDDSFPGYARDADPAFFSMAPADQRIDGFFTGEEPFLLENMHPTRSKIAGVLPGIAARTFLRRRQQTFEEVKTRLDSVVFLAGLEMGILIFRGTADIEEDDAADISHAFAACEDSNAPRGVGHYQSAFERRIDKDESPLLALQDDDLLPSFSSGSALAALLQSVAAKADAGATGARAAAEGRIRAELAARGMNAEALLAGVKARSAAEMPELAELDALLASPDLSTSAGLSALEKGIRATIEATRKYSAAAVAKTKEDVARLPTAESAQTLPPAPQAPQVLGALAGMGKPADAAMVAKLEQLDASAMKVYRRTAQYMVAGEGNDLSHRSMEGEDLRDALLGSANLSATNLARANLTGALLAHATCLDTNFDDVDLTAANLGAATLDGAHFENANLTKATLARTKLISVSFRGANLTDVDLFEAELGAVDFESATLPEVNFVRGQDLTKCRFAKARLHKSNFFESNLDGVDFSEAVLELVTFLAVSADGAIFREADLNRLHAVGGCSLRNACFDGANLDGAFLRGADLRGASFVGASMKGADLSECNLTGAKLTRARAREALFVRADLTGADIQSADLMDAMLQKSTLKNANLARASLFAANLGQVRLDTGTVVKDANLKRALLRPKLGSTS